MFTYEYPRPAVTVDLVAFAVHDSALQVLLIRRPEDPFIGAWTLPGGFVHDREPLEQTAVRVLSDKADLGDVFMEQLRSFGDPDRDPRDRIISVAYFAILPEGHVYSGPGSWFDVDALPELGFDHREIADVAIERLRSKLGYTDIALEFMSGSFTLGELQKKWEAVLGQALDKRNFRKSVAARKLVVETGRKSGGGAHPPAKLYRRRSGFGR